MCPLDRTSLSLSRPVEGNGASCDVELFLPPIHPGWALPMRRCGIHRLIGLAHILHWRPTGTSALSHREMACPDIVGPDFEDSLIWLSAILTIFGISTFGCSKKRRNQGHFMRSLEAEWLFPLLIECMKVVVPPNSQPSWDKSGLPILKLTRCNQYNEL